MASLSSWRFCSFRDSSTKKSTMGLVFLFLFLGEGVKGLATAVGVAALAPDVFSKGEVCIVLVAVEVLGSIIS